VWELLALVASRDLSKCLQSAVGLVLQNQAKGGAPKRVKELVDALQDAALASIEADIKPGRPTGSLYGAHGAFCINTDYTLQVPE
jgi:hypothetical protein